MRNGWSRLGVTVMIGLSLALGLAINRGTVVAAQNPDPAVTDLAMLSGDDFDREFLLNLMLHHAMAVMMARPVAERAPHAELRDLAAQMIADQTREINQMRSWLREWYGMDVPDPLMMMDATRQTSDGMAHQSMPDHGGRGGMDGDGRAMHGMSRDMDDSMRRAMMQAMELDGLPPNRLEAVFMSMMIMHHGTAIAMGELAVSRAAHDEIRMLGADVITTQSEERAKMNAWLQAWYGL